MQGMQSQHDLRDDETKTQNDCGPRNTSPTVVNKGTRSDLRPASKGQQRGKPITHKNASLKKDKSEPSSLVKPDTVLKLEVRPKISNTNTEMEREVLRIMQRIQKDMYDRAATGEHVDILAMQKRQNMLAYHAETSISGMERNLAEWAKNPPDQSGNSSMMEDDPQLKQISGVDTEMTMVEGAIPHVSS